MRSSAAQEGACATARSIGWSEIYIRIIQKACKMGWLCSCDMQTLALCLMRVRPASVAGSLARGGLRCVVVHLRRCLTCLLLHPVPFTLHIHPILRLAPNDAAVARGHPCLRGAQVPPPPSTPVDPRNPDPERARARGPGYTCAKMAELDIGLIVMACIIPFVLIFFNLVVMAHYIDPNAAAGHVIAKFVIVSRSGGGLSEQRSGNTGFRGCGRQHAMLPHCPQ
jgi:hypothetical protein